MSNNSVGATLAHRPAWLYFIAVMLAYAVVILSAKTPPHFVDYPDWVYQGVLFHGVITGHPVPGYALKPYPVPNSLTTAALGLLDTVFSWQLAAKLWICLYLVLAALATFLLSRALPVSRAMIVALPSVLFLNLDFWYGHISFEIGMCLVMILIALALRGANAITLALVMVVIFFAHMEALACAMLFLILWAAFKREWRKLWPLAASLVLTFWYAMARFAHGNPDAGATSTAGYAYGSRSFLIYKANTFFKPFGYVNARSAAGESFSEAVFGKILFVTLATCSVAAAILILILVVRALSVRDPSRSPLRMFILILLGLSLLLPHALLGTADPGSRLLLIAAMVGLFLADWRTRAAQVVAALSIILCVANVWQFARIQHNPGLQAHTADLSTPLLTYGHVEPFMRDSYYQHLSAGEMDLTIFPTAMFMRIR